MERLNNWMSYSFDNGPIFGQKTSRESIFQLHFATGIQIKNLHYFDAIKYNAQMVADNFSQPFDVLLSGGIDSEILVRINDLLGIKQNIYTFRLENDYNIRDVESAKDICKCLDIKLNIIDWNLQKWVENEAYDVYKKTKCPLIEKMARFDWYKHFDNIIVIGEGEPYWRRDLKEDYTKKSAWHLHWGEEDFVNSIFSKLTGKTIIGEWYNYTPEVVKSFHKQPLVKKLLNDEIIGKVSCWSSRYEIHKELFPNIKHKIKLVGYEGLLGYPSEKPAFMTAFQEEIINETANAMYKFTVDEIDNLLL